MKKRFFSVITAFVTAFAAIQTLPAAASSLRGDLNGDGELSVADAVLLMRFCAEDTTLNVTDELLGNADYVPDDVITLLDACVLLRDIAAATAAKPVTTVTTTTTAQPLPKYSIDEICDNPDAFEYYANSMWRDVLYRNGGMYRCNTIFNGSDCFYETRMMLLMLNDGLISDNVITKAFSRCKLDGFELDDLSDNTLDILIGGLIDIEDYFGGYVDFEQYSCTSNKESGREVNKMIQEYRNGNFDQYVDSINCNGLPCGDNSLVKSMIHVLDTNFKYKDYDLFDLEENYVYPLGDRIVSLINAE